MTTTYVVVPAGIDDPAHPSGGNIYDRRICDGLAALGWTVNEQCVPGIWPDADAASKASFSQVISVIPDGAVVLLDGLIASACGSALVQQASRLSLVVLMHMPLGADGAPVADEESALGAAAAVIVTSKWTRDRLLQLYPLAPEAVHVVEPGVEPATPAIGTPHGGGLLCVAAVAPHKGHDLLIRALGEVAEVDWHCTFVGALDLDPSFVERVRELAVTAGIDSRLRFIGPLGGADLDAAYSAADVLVLASRVESYGMVVTEALVRGIPVIAADIGGVPAALGRGFDGRSPGLLVPAGDWRAWATALRRWLTDADLRSVLRAAATQRSGSLTGWSVTSDRVSAVLAGVAT